MNRRSATAIAQGALLVLAILLAGRTFRLSDASYSATRTAGLNSISSGSVVLADDDVGASRFTLSGLRPETTSTACVRLTYSGSLAAGVKLYAQVTADTGLGPYATLVLRRGTGGAFSSCTGFVVTETVYTGTVGGLASTATNFASGLGSWAPTSGASTTYQIVVGVQNDPNARLKSVTFSLIWEAQSA